MPQFGLGQSQGFEPAPEGKQPAILAEISWAMIQNRFESDKGEELKMIWSFQLKAEDKQGERYVLDMELYPNISPKNQVGKLCQSWSASKEPLDQDQLNDWRGYLMGNLMETDVDNNYILDDKGVAQMKEFDTVFDFIEFTKSEEYQPLMVGATAIVEVAHNESKNGKVYANIKNIFVNAKCDEMGNPKFNAEGKPVRAFEMEISESYVGYHARQAEIAERIAKNKQQGKRSVPQSGFSGKAASTAAGRSKPPF